MRTFFDGLLRALAGFFDAANGVASGNEGEGDAGPFIDPDG